MKRAATVVGAACMIVAAYTLLAFGRAGEIGFPLDDAWIHQVYARNLGTHGELAFTPGQPSAGSTSPLWTLFLSPSYALGVDARLWTLALGALLLPICGLLTISLARRLAADLSVPAPKAWVVTAVVLLEWHLAWAAASGMEILLFLALSLAATWTYWKGVRTGVGLGLVSGLLIVTRPEGSVYAAILGVALVAQAAARWVGRRASLVRGAVPIVGLGAGALVPLAPYLWFNLATNGRLLPNTFYAKAEEYASLLAAPLWDRLYVVALQPLIGAQILLVPAALYLIWRAIEGKKWNALVPALWVVALLTLYAWRLPVAYQHGRYEMPAIPFLLMYGIVGFQALLPRLPRVIGRAWALSIALLVVLFWLIGAGQYATDVAIVQCEMVGTARWSAANLPRGALVAVHDIGAQGYWSQNPLLDLAGLASPEVIPFLRDETRLEVFLKQAGAEYLIAFPSWYPRLTTRPGVKPLYSPACRVTQEAGSDSLKVYRLDW